MKSAIHSIPTFPTRSELDSGGCSEGQRGSLQLPRPSDCLKMSPQIAQFWGQTKSDFKVPQNHSGGWGHHTRPQMLPMPQHVGEEKALDQASHTIFQNSGMLHFWFYLKQWVPTSCLFRAGLGTCRGPLGNCACHFQVLPDDNREIRSPIKTPFLPLCH